MQKVHKKQVSLNYAVSPTNLLGKGESLAQGRMKENKSPNWSTVLDKRVQNEKKSKPKQLSWIIQGGKPENMANNENERPGNPTVGVSRKNKSTRPVLQEQNGTHRSNHRVSSSNNAILGIPEKVGHSLQNSRSGELFLMKTIAIDLSHQILRSRESQTSLGSSKNMSLLHASMQEERTNFVADTEDWTSQLPRVPPQLCSLPNFSWIPHIKPNQLPVVPILQVPRETPTGNRSIVIKDNVTASSSRTTLGATSQKSEGLREPDIQSQPRDMEIQVIIQKKFDQITQHHENSPVREFSSGSMMMPFGSRQHTPSSRKEDTCRENTRMAPNPANINNENQKSESKITRRSAQSLVSRLYLEHSVNNQRNKALIKKYENELMKECTFTPQILNKPRSVPKPSGGVAESIDLKKIKNSNVLDLESGEGQDSVVGRPPLSSQSGVRVSSASLQGRSNVHERLYNKHRSHSKKESSLDGHLPEMPHSAREHSKTAKAASLLRTVELYNDAFRRREQMEKLSSQSVSKLQSPTISRSSQRLLQKKVVREYENAVESLFGKTSLTAKFDLTNIIAIFHALGFVPAQKRSGMLGGKSLGDGETTANNIAENSNSGDIMNHITFMQSKLLINDVWQILLGQQQNGVTNRNLMVMVLAIYGLQYDDEWNVGGRKKNHSRSMVKSDDEAHHLGTGNSSQKKKDINVATSSICIYDQKQSESDDNLISYSSIASFPVRRLHPTTVGHFDDDGDYQLTPEQVANLHKHFIAFYWNKIASEEKQPTSAANEEQKFPSKAGLSTTLTNGLPPLRRDQLAQKRREKLLNSAQELFNRYGIDIDIHKKNLSIEDILHIEKALLENEKKLFEKEIEQTRMKECTFKPAINSLSSEFQDSYNLNKENGGKHKALELYEMGKRRPARQDKPKEELDFEKHEHECTFKPNIELSKTQPLRTFSENPPPLIQNFDKTVSRMRIAWEDHELRESSIKHRSKSGSQTQKPLQRKNENETKVSKRPKIPSILRSIASEKALGGEESKAVKHSDTGKVASTLAKEVESPRGVLENQMPIGNKNGPVAPVPNNNEPEDENEPILFVAVNLGHGKSETIVVNEGDKTEILAANFALKHSLDKATENRLKEMLDAQLMNNQLGKIDEESGQVTEESDDEGGK